MSDDKTESQKHLTKDLSKLVEELGVKYHLPVFDYTDMLLSRGHPVISTEFSRYREFVKVPPLHGKTAWRSLPTDTISIDDIRESYDKIAEGMTYRLVWKDEIRAEVSDEGGLRYKMYKEEKEPMPRVVDKSNPWLSEERKGRYDSYWVYYPGDWEDPYWNSDRLQVPVATLDKEEAKRNMKDWQTGATFLVEHEKSHHSSRWDRLPESTKNFLESVIASGKYMTEKQARAVCRTVIKYKFCQTFSAEMLLEKLEGLQKKVTPPWEQPKKEESKVTTADIKKAAKDAIQEVYNYAKPLDENNSSLHEARTYAKKAWNDTQKLRADLGLVQGDLQTVLYTLNKQQQEESMGLAPWKVLEGRELDKVIKVYDPDGIALAGSQESPRFTITNGYLNEGKLKEVLKAKYNDRMLISVKDVRTILEDHEQLKKFYELNKPVPRKRTRWEKVKDTTKASAHKAVYVGAGVAGTLAALVF